MKLNEAIKICQEMQKWRRGQEPYDAPNTMPYSSSTFGEAMDVLLENAVALEEREEVKIAVNKAKSETKRDIIEGVRSFFKSEYRDEYLSQKLVELIMKK